MNRLTRVSAAAALLAMVAGPAMAQSGYVRDSINLQEPDVNPQWAGAQPNSPPYGGDVPVDYYGTAPVSTLYSGSYAYTPEIRSRDGFYRHTGFLPADIAAGAIGGAVGLAGAAVNTAGVIATAPFRGNYARNAYASMDDNSCAQRFRSYDPASGTYLGYDGQRHACQ